MRDVLIHYHIFKNAGSSIDLLLAEAYGERWLAWDPGDADAVHDAQTIVRVIQANPHVAALSSHTLRLPLPVMANVRVTPLLFFRHPLLRTASVYKYDRSLDGSTERQRVARQSSFADYIRWLLDAPGVPIISDFMTLYLSGDQLRYEDPTAACAGRGSFARAIATLEELDVFGIVERFDASIDLFAHRLRHRFPEISWRAVQENVTEARLSTLDEIRSELGDDLYRQLEERNRMDLALYAHAQQLFDHLLEFV